MMRVVYTIRRRDGTFLVGGAFARPLSTREAAGLLPHQPEELETEQVGDALVAKFPAYSRLDQAMIETVDGQLAALAEEWGARPVIVNLERVAGLNSSMLRQLVTFNQRVNRAGGRLALCAVAPEVTQVLDKIRLTELLPIYPTEQEALLAS
jgi:anti-sigma B factor antagonist